ncbi:MAG: hypothetical protein F6K42_00420 [Leptolyngbya sp. SIO1D8]|nr:hypothetical protein [Leptolyngbya sp. SIO1D8]
MKGVIRKLTYLSLASVAAMFGSILALPQSALALSEEEILEKLTTVPVFLIVNGEGQSLTASVDDGADSDVQVPIVFIHSAEAEAFLDQAEEEQSEIAAEAQIAVLPLSEVYAEASAQLDGVSSLVYIPSSESVNQASQLVEQDIQGVPLFAAVDIDNDQYLLTSNNRLPMFFSFQDLQAQLSTLIQNNPELENSIGVEVVSFEAILSNMDSEDPDLNRFLELIQFVPASQTLQYLQSAPAGGEGQ